MPRSRSATPPVVQSIVAGAVALLVLAACSRSAEPGGTAGDAPAATEQAVAASAVEAAPAPSPALARSTVPPGDAAAMSQGTGDVPPPASATPMLIRRGEASVEVDSLEAAIAAVTQAVGRLGGMVGSTTISSGDGRVRSATLELRIPAARYDEALAGLRPLGDVESVTTTVEDVGEEYVDLGARTANARRLEERLVQLLATRTGKLEDVLAVERELARVREEIERHEGRMRWLRTRAATSTLALTLHEPAPLVGSDPQGSVIGDAFIEAWRNFVRTIASLIALAGTLVPIGAVLVVIGLVIRRIRLRATGRA